jgi:hypothetical protein
MPAERELERLVVKVLADPAPFLAGMRQVEAAAVQTFRAVSAVAAPFLGISGLFKGIQLAAQSEQMETLFGTMLGGADKGEALNRQLIEMSRNLPVGLAQLQHGAQMLLGMGTAGNQLVPVLEDIANVSGGMPQRMEAMIRALARAEEQGHLTHFALRSLSLQGFNPLMEMARTTGRSMQQLERDLHAGRITADMLRQAYHTAGQEGGIAFGLIGSQAQKTMGLWRRLENEVANFLRTVGEAAIKGLNLNEVMGQTIEYLRTAAAWFERQSDATKKFIFQVVAAAVALGAFILLWPLLAGVAGSALTVLLLPLTLVLGVLKLLHVQQVIGLALWLVWKVAVLAATVTVAVYTAVLFLATKAVAFLTSGTVLATISATLFGLSWAGVGAAMTAVLPIFLALTVTAGLWVAAVGLVVAAAVAAAAAFKAFVEVVSAADLTRPLEFVSGMLRDWWDMLKKVARVAKGDLGQAWELLQLGAQVAVEQIKTLWTPLWGFIQRGFFITADVVTEVFWQKFNLMTEKLKKNIADSLNIFEKLGLVKGVLPGWDKSLAETEQQTNKTIQHLVKNAAFEMGKMSGKMFAGLKESDETTKLKKQFEDLFGWDIVTTGMMPEKKSEELGGKQGRAYVGAVEKEMKRMDAVLSGSTAALVRQEDFYNLISGGRGGGYAQAGGRGLEQRGQGLRSGSGEALGVQEKQLGKLGAIAEGINQLNQKPGVNIRVGGLLR